MGKSPQAEKAVVVPERWYIVRCGHCGRVAEASVGHCPFCGYDGVEPRSEGIEVVRVASGSGSDVARETWTLERHAAGGVVEHVVRTYGAWADKARIEVVPVDARSSGCLPTTASEPKAEGS